MSNTPLTDEIIKYCDYQFPATQGHIPLRTMIEKIEKENAELKELLSEIQDWMMDNDYECGPVGSKLYEDISKIFEQK